MFIFQPSFNNKQVDSCFFLTVGQGESYKIVNTILNLTDFNIVEWSWHQKKKKDSKTRNTRLDVRIIFIVVSQIKNLKNNDVISTQVIIWERTTAIDRSDRRSMERRIIWLYVLAFWIWFSNFMKLIFWKCFTKVS